MSLCIQCHSKEMDNRRLTKRVAELETELRRLVNIVRGHSRPGDDAERLLEPALAVLPVEKLSTSHDVTTPDIVPLSIDLDSNLRCVCPACKRKWKARWELVEVPPETSSDRSE